MKFLFLALIFPIFLHGQENIFDMPIDSTTGKISWQGIIGAPSIKKEDLFNKAKLWVIQYYKSPKDVINAEDREIGVLKLKGIISRPKESGTLKYESALYYDLDIFVKDEKLKYIIHEIYHSIITPRDKDDKTPIERPFFISRSDTVQMKFYEYRKTWSDEIKFDFSNIIASLTTFLKSKTASDF